MRNWRATSGRARRIGRRRRVPWLGWNVRRGPDPNGRFEERLCRRPLAHRGSMERHGSMEFACATRPRGRDPFVVDDPRVLLFSRAHARISDIQERGRCASAATRSPSGGHAHATGCWTNGRSRRKGAIADRGLERLNWADSAPTRVGSGRTGVRAKAAIPYRVRNRLYGPEQKFRCACRPPHSKQMRPYIKPRCAT